MRARTDGPLRPDLTALRATDVAELARVHARGFPGFFLTSLGQPFLREFYRAHLDDDSAVAVVARTRSGRPIGVVVGTLAPAGFYGRLLRRRGPAFALAGARGAVRHPRAVPRLLRALTYRGDAPDRPGAALLSSLVVDPPHSGRGIGAALVEAWTAEAAARGATQAVLTTDARDNDAVNAFYLARGWRPDGDLTTPQGRAMRRYVIDLSPPGTTTAHPGAATSTTATGAGRSDTSVSSTTSSSTTSSSTTEKESRR